MAARVTRTDGADLLVRRKPGCGLVSIGAFFPGLPDQEQPDTAGISWLVARAALRGAGGLDAATLATEAERLGGSVHPGVGAETVGWALTVRPDAARAAADLLRRLAAEPTLAPDDVVIERDLLADDAARARDDMFRYPLQQALGQAFPDDPYGLPALGTPASVARLGPEAVEAWAERLQRARPVVVAVGDASEDALRDAVSVFAAWPATDNGRPGQGNASWAGNRAHEQRTKTQSALAMAFPAPPRGTPARYTLKVMIALLSGMAGRLFEALREQRGLAYTVHAQAWLRRRASAVLTYIATAPERETEARDVMLEELDRLRREPVPPDELERARNYAAGLVAIRRQHASALMSEIADAWLHDTLDDLDEEERRLRAVPADEISAVSETVFRAAERAEYVVRGTATGR